MCSFVCVKSWDGGERGGWALFGAYSVKETWLPSLSVHLTRSSLASLFKMANFSDTEGRACCPQSLRRFPIKQVD